MNLARRWLGFAAGLIGIAAIGTGGHAQTLSSIHLQHVSSREDEIPRGAARRDIEPMKANDKARWYVRHSFDAGSLLIPALPAAIIMADPPKRYPNEWRTGAAGFGRNFGDALATETAANTGRFVAGLLTHEDPRYYPDQSKNAWHRVGYALAFTVIDRSDNGRPRLAISNIAGATAAGFIGRVYLPSGYDDLSHAGQRTAGTYVGYIPTLLVGYATGNLVTEFRPELKWLGRKLHVPFVSK